ncbi:MAG: glycoside hydrolase family 44 protein [Ruminococcus sp.]|nr:glycoside hydrolase family 44 protein [Ruminococcus sp.]
MNRKKIKYNSLNRVMFRLLPVFAIVFYIFSLPVYAAPNVSVLVDTSRDRVAISPYIYGLNENSGTPPVKAFAIKQQGDFLDTYNWEIDAANTGWTDNSENIALVPKLSGDVINMTAAFPSMFLENAISSEVPGRFINLPMSGYAAADSDGLVYTHDFQNRVVRILDRKQAGAEYLSHPDLTDGFVYNDEYLAYMVNRSEADGGITGYILGSAPEKMKDTFRVIDMPEITAVSLTTKTIEAAKTVKYIDPRAAVLAPGVSNLEGYINLSNPLDFETHSDEYSWYIDYFLDSFKKASDTAGERLLDSLDLQFYTEAVTDSGQAVLTSETAAANAARIQAPRLFYDSTYSESSKAAVTYKAYTPLLPTLQASIRMYYPGTKLSFSEYSFGGGGDVSGGIAVADTLGIFGKNLIYMAGLSPSNTEYSAKNGITPVSEYDYEYAGLKIYTDYDDAGSSFGSTSVFAASSGMSASVYASTGSINDSTLTVLYINKSGKPETAHFLLFSNSDYDNVRIFGFDEKTSTITERTTSDDVVNTNIFEYDIPPGGVYMFEFTGIPHSGAFTTAELPDEDYTETTPAVTDPYGVTITSTAGDETTLPPPEINPGADAGAETPFAATTVYAPETEFPQTDSDMPIAVRVIAIILLFTVIGVFSYVIFVTIRK